MLELYQFEQCPHSQKVRQRLSDWGIDYVLHNVPKDLEKRTHLMKVSGQARVPTLVDSDRERILAGDENEILSYLIEFYKPQDPAPQSPQTAQTPSLPADALPVEEPSFPDDASGGQKKTDFKGYA